MELHSNRPTRSRVAGKVTAVAVLSAAGLLLLSACGGSSTSTESTTVEATEAASATAVGSATAAPATDEPAGEIVVGLNLEMSGPGSFLGEGMKAGIEAAVAKINADGGINGQQVTVIAKDNQSDPAQAVALVTELKQDGASIILGPGFAQDCAAAAPALIREDIVGLCMSAGNLPEDSSNMFGIGIDYTVMESTIAEQFAAAGIKKVGLVAASDTSGTQTVDLFVPDAEALGMTVDVERFNSPANDLSAQILAVSKEDPDAIRIQATGPDAGVGVSNVKALGITTGTWLPNSSASFYFADMIKGEVGAGNVYTWIPAMLSPTGLTDFPNQAAQIEALTAALPTADTITAAGWDGMQVAAIGLSAAGATDAASIISALQSMDMYYGAYSVQQITAEDHRGAVSEGTMIPAAFTTDGKFELVP